jgi:arylsulfatase A-like enzyme
MTATRARPARNLLLITTDQERWFDDDPVPLPGHAWLRRHGTTFDRFYAASMACSPARSVMYTGQHVPITGVIDNVGVAGQPDLTTAVPTLGTLLGARGYRCAYKGKWHLSVEALAQHATGPLPDALEAYGFSDYNDVGDDIGLAYEGHGRDDAIAADAVKWLTTEGSSANASGVPWCLAVNFVNPHDIMFGSVDAAMMEKNRSRTRGRWFTGPPDAEIYRATWDLADDPTWSDAFDRSVRPAAHLDYLVANQLFTGTPASTPEELRQFRDYYLNCMREVDMAIMTVIDGLRTADLADDTVVVLTSDHGELGGAHGLFGKGPCAYDENLRVPLIVVDPQRPAGGRTAVIGSQLDLVPTMLSLVAGSPSAPLPGQLPGRDLSAALDGGAPAVPRREALFVYEMLIFVDGDWALRTFAGMRTDDPVTGRDFTKRGLMRTLITDRFKFSRYFSPGDHHRPASIEELLARNTLELFDLEDDPLERVDLAVAPIADTLALIEHLDSELSSLIAAEVGDDDGHWLPRFEGAPWVR